MDDGFYLKQNTSAAIVLWWFFFIAMLTFKKHPIVIHALNLRTQSKIAN